MRLEERTDLHAAATVDLAALDAVAHLELCAAVRRGESYRVVALLADASDETLLAFPVRVQTLRQLLSAAETARVRWGWARRFDLDTFQRLDQLLTGARG